MKFEESNYLENPDSSIMGYILELTVRAKASK